MVCLYGRLPLFANVFRKTVSTSTRKIFLCPMCMKITRNVSDVSSKNQTISRQTTEDNMAWEMLVDYSKLSPQELKIHQKHSEAVRNNKLSYTDPSTGYLVMTRLSHLDRGECCGNACRHCPYGQKNVPEELKKTFNSAFYS